MSISKPSSCPNCGPKGSPGDSVVSLGDLLNRFNKNESGDSAGGIGEEIVDKAEDRLGEDYVWGGEGEEKSGGIDCSGLVVDALARSGRPIEDMTAATMQQNSEVVDPGSAKAGDLLIWDDGKHVEIVKNTTGGSVETVGSSSSSGGVVNKTHQLSGKKIHSIDSLTDGGSHQIG